MGRNMKKSKQNVVSKVKDFKKQKVKVGRKLKNIAETLPKVKVAKINVRSQFTEDLPYNPVGLLLDDKTEATQELPPLTLAGLQQLSEQLLTTLKQTQAGKKMDTRRDFLTSTHNLLFTNHPHLSSANLQDLLETLCPLMVDPETAIRIAANKVLRVVLSKVLKSKGLTEDQGLDWDNDNFPILLAYTLRSMSIPAYNSTSLLNLQLIFDLCPLVALSSSFRISQSLLKMLLNQNSGVLSKNKGKQILSLEGNEWSSIESANHTASLYTRLHLIKTVSNFYEVMLHGDVWNKNSTHPDSLINQSHHSSNFSADIIKIMTDVFIDEFYKARKQGVKKEFNEVVVVLTQEVLDVMTSCVKCIHHSLLFIHRVCPSSAISHGNISNSINALCSPFPFSIHMTGYKENKKSKKINNSVKKNLGGLTEIDIGHDLNEDVAAVILLFIQHPSIHQSLNPSVITHHCKRFHRFDHLCYKLIKFMSINPLPSLPYIQPFYHTLIRHYMDDKKGMCCEYLIKQDNKENKKSKTDKSALKSNDRIKQLGGVVVECGRKSIGHFLSNIDASWGAKQSIPGGDQEHCTTSGSLVKWPSREVIFWIKLLSPFVEEFDSDFSTEIKLTSLKYLLLNFEATKKKGRMDMKSPDLSFMLQQVNSFVKSAEVSQELCMYLGDNIHQITSYVDSLKLLPPNEQKLFLYLLTSAYRTFFLFHNNNNDNNNNINDDNNSNNKNNNNNNDVLSSLMTQTSNKILSLNPDLLFILSSSLFNNSLERGNTEEWEELVCRMIASHFIVYTKGGSDVYNSKSINVLNAALANLLTNSTNTLITLKSFMTGFIDAAGIHADNKDRLFIISCHLHMCVAGSCVVEDGDDDVVDVAGMDVVDALERCKEVCQRFSSPAEVLGVLRRLIILLFSSITKYKSHDRPARCSVVENDDKDGGGILQQNNLIDYENVREIMKRRYHGCFSDFQIANLTRVILTM